MSQMPRTIHTLPPITQSELDLHIKNACALKPAPATHRGALFFHYAKEDEPQFAKVLLSRQDQYWVAEDGSVYYDDPHGRPFYTLPLAKNGVSLLTADYARDDAARAMGALSGRGVVPYDGTPPRQWTAEEMAVQFVRYAFQMAKYWTDEPVDRLKGIGSDTFHRMTGLLHTLFSMMDGSSGGLPGFTLVPVVKADDIAFHQMLGENWWPVQPELDEQQVVGWPLVDIWRVVAKEYDEHLAEEAAKNKPVEQEIRAEHTREGVVIECEGRYWGVLHPGGGHGEGTTYGWTTLDKADIYDPQFCKTPTAVTYQGSPYVEQLQRGRLLPLKRTTTTVVTLTP